MNGSGRLPIGLYALCDDGLRPELTPLEKANQVLAGGARILQMRLKNTPDGVALPLLKHVVALCERHQAVCVVNDRVDLALLSGANAVHLGDEDLPPQTARALLGPRAWVGVTVRNLEAILQAKADGADYVGLGPIFETSTKQVAAPTLGLAPLAAWARVSPLPIVAIGGIGPDTIEAVAATGVWGAAVGAGLLCAADVPVRARQLLQGFERGRKGANFSQVG